MSDLQLWLDAAGVRLEGSINRYREAEPIETCKVNWNGSEGRATTALGAEWTVNVACEGLADSKEGLGGIAEFRSNGSSQQSTVALSFHWSEWSERNYVLVPGAIYAGNRFGVRSLPYAPCWSKLDDHGPDVPTLITDVPRLSIEPGRVKSKQGSRLGNVLL